MMNIDKSDLLKIYDAVKRARDCHLAQDQMNAHIHCAPETRHGPLTSELMSATERIENILMSKAMAEEDV